MSVACLAATLLTGVLTSGCSGASGDEEVSPLHDVQAMDAGRSPAADEDPTDTSEGSHGDAPAGNAPGGTGVAESAKTLEDLLSRFDAAISGLYAEPLAAGDDNDPLSVQWLAVVVGGSQLDRQVRGRIFASGTDDGMRILPDANGISFRNVALEVDEEPDGSLRWTNCGYAPGVGVDLETGQVLDDNRTSTRGRGKAVREADGTLLISELWDDESHLLTPGAPDPCIELAREETGGMP